MQCDAVKYYLPDFVKNSCPDKEMQEIAGHIRGCHRCRSIAESFQSTFQKIDSITRSAPDPYFWNNFRVGVNGKIENKKNLRYPTMWLQKIVLPALASALFLFVAIRFHPVQSYESFSNIIKESEILPILNQSNSSELKTIEQAYEDAAWFHPSMEIAKTDRRTADLAVKSLAKSLLDETSKNDLLASSTELATDSDIMNNLSDTEASEIVDHIKSKTPF